MIVLDIRQDVLDKNKVLSQFLESSGAFSDSKTAILSSNNSHPTNNSTDDTTNAKESAVVDNSQTKSTENSKTSKDVCMYSTTEAADSSNVTMDVTNMEILMGTEEIIETHGVLDAQTEIYNFETTGKLRETKNHKIHKFIARIVEQRNRFVTDDTVIEDQVEELMPTSGIDIFSTALASANINLENFHYANDDDEEMIHETNNDILSRSPISTVEHLNEFGES